MGIINRIAKIYISTEKDERETKECYYTFGMITDFSFTGDYDSDGLKIFEYHVDLIDYEPDYRMIIKNIDVEFCIMKGTLTKHKRVIEDEYTNDISQWIAPKVKTRLTKKSIIDFVNRHYKKK